MPATTPGQRFIQLIQQLGLTKNAFAQSLGKTATVIQHIVDERNKPGYDLLNRVCEVYPNVSSEWLLRGLGPMMREATSGTVAPSPPTVPGGIDVSEVPGAARRRNGNLLQPADIAATLVLAGQSHNGHHDQAPATEPHGPAPVAALASTAPRSTPTLASAPSALPASPATVAAEPADAPAPATPSSTLPDPAYLTAALHTQHLQHQLALAEQRNQHLLEQQALLRQMLELVQRRP